VYYRGDFVNEGAIVGALGEGDKFVQFCCCET
jgi:hypothetical protein